LNWIQDAVQLAQAERAIVGLDLFTNGQSIDLVERVFDDVARGGLNRRIWWQIWHGFLLVALLESAVILSTLALTGSNDIRG
jgi:hypothetical protein